MARDCEIDECGVLAVGRCAICRRTFCGSHQAITPGTSLYPAMRVVDRCTLCDQSVKRDAAAYRAANPTPLEAARALIRDVSPRMRAAGHTPTPLVETFTGRRLVQRFLRKVEEEYTTVTPIGDCWVLGMAPWRVPDVSERGRIEYRSTGIVESAIRNDVSPRKIVQLRGSQNGVAVLGTTIGWEGDYLYDREGTRQTGWEILADLIRARLRGDTV